MKSGYRKSVVKKLVIKIKKIAGNTLLWFPVKMRDTGGIDMSIKKIAAIAGVSTATVSRVLNNPDYKCSSEELQQRYWNI